MVSKSLAALGFQVLGRSLCGNPRAVFASVRWVNCEYKTFSSGFDSDTGEFLTLNEQLYLRVGSLSGICYI